MGGKESEMAQKREWDPEEADLEAKLAADELIDMGPYAPVSQLADWWRRHYLIAGHKRLARVLMAIK